jgi:hypothetical protein
MLSSKKMGHSILLAWYRKNVIKIFVGKPEGREYLGDLRVDGEVIIKVQI